MHHKGRITPLHAGIMHAGYHGNILVGKKQENCRSLCLLHVTIVTCMPWCNSSIRLVCSAETGLPFALILVWFLLS